MNCTYDPYTLPQLEFVGGETQVLEYRVYFKKKSNPFDLSGCTAVFSIVSATQKNGASFLDKTMHVVSRSDIEDPELVWETMGSATSANTIDVAISNVLTVTLDPVDTVDLFGKYIYQISIRNAAGEVEIPNKGVMYIDNNIYKSFARQA